MPALEQNIIRYCAIDMTRTLFHAEALRRTVIGYLQLSGAKNPLDAALNSLLAAGIINEPERAELKNLIDYRNHIAHRLEQLNADVTAAFAGFVRSGSDFWPKYNDAASNRLVFYEALLQKRTRGSYEQQLSFAPLLFAPTEMALKAGLRRLGRTIDRQLAARRIQNEN